VDRNLLAVDLCRVALWLESHTAGEPLTFLDHRIRCGDSRVGAFDLGVLAQGNPDKPCDLWTAAFFQTLAADSVVITSTGLADRLGGRPIDARLHGCAGALTLRQPFCH
jgi:hypothetical protein